MSAAAPPPSPLLLSFPLPPYSSVSYSSFFLSFSSSSFTLLSLSSLLPASPPRLSLHSIIPSLSLFHFRRLLSPLSLLLFASLFRPFLRIVLESSPRSAPEGRKGGREEGQRAKGEESKCRISLIIVIATYVSTETKGGGRHRRVLVIIPLRLIRLYSPDEFQDGRGPCFRKRTEAHCLLARPPGVRRRAKADRRARSQTCRK